VSDDTALAQIIAATNQGVLATIKPDGYPQLSNILYLWDPDRRIARISTTARRLKARNLRRDRHAALHVSGDHFWAFAVAEATAELSDVCTTPGDAAGRELNEIHTAFYGELDPGPFYADMVANRRLVIRLHVHRLYGIALPTAPGT
jgi:PPOX class probable F420-dependent enzyme